MQWVKIIHNHEKDIWCVMNVHLEQEYSSKRKRVKESLTTSGVQFKKDWINEKVDCVKAWYSKNSAPNRFQQGKGYTLTPLMQGKIQYGKMRKRDNMGAVRE